MWRRDDDDRNDSGESDNAPDPADLLGSLRDLLARSDPAPLPLEATQLEPGSKAKMKVLRRRLQARQQLHHPHDRQYVAPPPERPEDSEP